MRSLFKLKFKGTRPHNANLNDYELQPNFKRLNFIGLKGYNLAQKAKSKKMELKFKVRE